MLPRQLNCKMFALIPGECYQQAIWWRWTFRAFKILHLKYKPSLQKAFHVFTSRHNFTATQPVQIQIIRLFYKHFTPLGPSARSLRGCGFHWTWEKQFYKGHVLMFSLWHVVKCSGKRGHETCRGDGGNEKMTDKRKPGRARRGRRGGNLTSSHCGALTRQVGKVEEACEATASQFSHFINAHAHAHAFADWCPRGHASTWHFIHIQMSSPIHSPPPLQSMLHLVKPLCGYRQRSDVYAAARGRPGNISRLDDNGRQVAANKRHEVSNYSSAFNCWNPNAGLIHLKQAGPSDANIWFPLARANALMKDLSHSTSGNSSRQT